MMIENFGKNVARLRKEQGYSQEQLAKEIEVNRQTISNIERGARYPTFETLEKIAKLFKATPTQLFGTPKEIAVSDTPAILNEIDKYNSKIQAILQVPKIIEEYKEPIADLAYQVQSIQNFIQEEFVTTEDGHICYDDNEQAEVKEKLQAIRNISTEVRIVRNFFERPFATEYDGGIIFNDDGTPQLTNSPYQNIPIKEIEELANNIRYIKKNQENFD